MAHCKRCPDGWVCPPDADCEAQIEMYDAKTNPGGNRFVSCVTLPAGRYYVWCKPRAWMATVQASEYAPVGWEVLGSIMLDTEDSYDLYCQTTGDKCVVRVTRTKSGGCCECDDDG